MLDIDRIKLFNARIVDGSRYYLKDPCIPAESDEIVVLLACYLYEDQYRIVLVDDKANIIPVHASKPISAFFSNVSYDILYETAKHALFVRPFLYKGKFVISDHERDMILRKVADYLHNI